MAKKKPAQQKASQPRAKAQSRSRSQRRWRQRLLVGGIALVLVIGIGVFIRYRQQRMMPPRLQGAVENHYTRGTAGAPVVVKEFSDYT
jgi:hypothetical protein